MNFTRLKVLLFNQLHTYLFILGCLLIVVAVGLLAGTEWGLIATGIFLIIMSVLIDKET